MSIPRPKSYKSKSLSQIPLTQEINEAEKNTNARLEALTTLASKLLIEISKLSATPRSNLSHDFDFYKQTRDFEIDLIKRALVITGGNQSRAAALLKMQVTTLNTKIRTLNISHKDAAETSAAISTADFQVQSNSGNQHNEETAEECCAIN